MKREEKRLDRAYIYLNLPYELMNTSHDTSRMYALSESAGRDATALSSVGLLFNLSADHQSLQVPIQHQQSVEISSVINIGLPGKMQRVRSKLASSSYRLLDTYLPFRIISRYVPLTFHVHSKAS